MERRLAAILVADVVGYSRLLREDEAGTLAALQATRKDILEPLIDKHRGRLVKLMGDGALVEFGSAVSAVQCAVELQEATQAAPNPLSIFTTVTFDAQLFSIPSSAATPPKLAP